MLTFKIIVKFLFDFFSPLHKECRSLKTEISEIFRHSLCFGGLGVMVPTSLFPPSVG